jgi:L-threonylcarbamoyladenylate synthase
MGQFVNISEAIEGLKEGKTLLYPTDTIWGLGCMATNEQAIQRIKDLKNRPPDKSFIVLVNNVAMLERSVEEVPEVCYDIIDFSEKPTTIIYDNPIGVSKLVCANDGTLGIRVTENKTCQRLIQGIRCPLVSTSANISNSPSPKGFSTIAEEIKEGVDMILNERLDEEMTSPSSIIKIGNNNNVEVIR